MVEYQVCHFSQEFMIDEAPRFSSCAPKSNDCSSRSSCIHEIRITIINHPPTKNSKNETSESVTKHKKHTLHTQKMWPEGDPDVLFNSVMQHMMFPRKPTNQTFVPT